MQIVLREETAYYMPVEIGQCRTRERDEMNEDGGEKYQIRCGYFQDLEENILYFNCISVELSVMEKQANEDNV